MDREKARTLGVPVDSVFQTLQAYLSGMYVNDFVKFGRVYKVFLQAEPQVTNTPDDIGKFYVRNNSGGMVPLLFVPLSYIYRPSSDARRHAPVTHP